MTYKEIITKLLEFNCKATASRLAEAVGREACDLIDAQTRMRGFNDSARDFGAFKTKPKNSRYPDEKALGFAADFYADDITNLFHSQEQPNPTNMLTQRRFAVAWAVAEVLRTRNDIREELFTLQD